MQHHGFYGCNLGESRGLIPNTFAFHFMSVTMCFYRQHRPKMANSFAKVRLIVYQPVLTLYQTHKSIENGVAWNIISVFYLNV